MHCSRAREQQILQENQIEIDRIAQHLSAPHSSLTNNHLDNRGGSSTARPDRRAVIVPHRDR